MKKRNLLKLLMPVSALLAFSSISNATLVAPGGSVSADPTVTVGPGATLLASTGPVNVSNLLSGLNATYTEYVYADPNGLCVGCLDFVIAATDNNSSTDIIQSITGSTFGSAVTDVGYSSQLNGGGVLSGVAPTNVTRSLNGGVVSFDFRPAEIQTGQFTQYLIIRTDAVNFIPGTVTIQDGAAETGAGFGVAPEPNMVSLLSLLALGIIGIAYRQKMGAAKNTNS